MDAKQKRAPIILSSVLKPNTGAASPEVLPSILPVLAATNIEPFSVNVAWTYGGRDPRYLFNNLSYQFSYAEAETLSFEVLYEGDETMYTLTDLKPLTKYIFKLRIDFTQNVEKNMKTWSKAFTEIEVSTTAETQAVKMTAQFLRSITLGDIQKASAIFKEYGKNLSLESRDKSGKTLLMIACQAGFDELANLLIEAGATIQGKTALSFSISQGCIKTAQVLLTHDPTQVSHVDLGMSSPLMWAAENANVRNGVAMVQLLVDAGSDINQMDENSRTAFDRLCISSGNMKAAEILIDNGARVINKIQKDKGFNVTSLMTCALNGHKDMCHELMDRWGADPAEETEHGGNAKNFSAAQGHKEITEMITEKLKEVK